MKNSHRVRMGLGLALVATLIAAWFAPAPQDYGAELSDRVDRAPKSAHQQSSLAAMALPTGSNLRSVKKKNTKQSSSHVQVLRVRDRHYGEEEKSIFANPTWEHPGATTNAAAIPSGLPKAWPAPTSAPALPFRYMGRYEESGKSVIFLLQADKSWVVGEGDRLGEIYKVEKIAFNAIHFRHLPFDEVQVLELSVAP